MTLLDPSRLEIKLGSYGVGTSMAIADVSLLPRVQDYRRRLSARMSPLGKQDITKKIMPAEYHVSRKIDGEFTVLVYRAGQAFCINPGGTVRAGLPWLAEAEKLFAKAKIKEALIAGELYVARNDRRPRVHDVNSIARNPASQAELSQLQFAVFDLISLDDKPADEDFAATWQRIGELFSAGEKIHPVEAREAVGLEDIQKLFEQWVEEEGGEGLVVRSETAGMFKIKPRHTLDAVVVGFTESVDDREGMLHDLLLAVRRGDETLQILTRVGGGFSEEQRREFLSDLKDITVESEYAEINSDHVAYQMVRPEWVIEISCLDLVAETTRGGAIHRMVLDWNRDSSDKYHIVRRMPLVSVISPQFIRRREDKTPTRQDIRIEQVTAIVDVPLADRDAKQLTLPQSELLQREVYTKEAKGEVMVRKFVMWKTNKDENEDYPGYVLHYTDFSPNRKSPLARDIRVSDSLEQIEHLWNELVEANIKRGWNLHEPKVQPATVAAEPAPVAVTPAEAAKAPAKKKAAAKKPAAKKKPAKTKTKKAATEAEATKKKAAGKMAKSAQDAEDKAAKKTKKKSG